MGVGVEERLTTPGLSLSITSHSAVLSLADDDVENALVVATPRIAYAISVSRGILFPMKTARSHILIILRILSTMPDLGLFHDNQKQPRLHTHPGDNEISSPLSVTGRIAHRHALSRHNPRHHDTLTWHGDATYLFC